MPKQKKSRTNLQHLRKCLGPFRLDVVALEVDARDGRVHLRGDTKNGILSMVTGVKVHVGGATSTQTRLSPWQKLTETR